MWVNHAERPPPPPAPPTPVGTPVRLLQIGCDKPASHMAVAAPRFLSAGIDVALMKSLHRGRRRMEMLPACHCWGGGSPQVSLDSPHWGPFVLGPMGRGGGGAITALRSGTGVLTCYPRCSELIITSFLTERSGVQDEMSPPAPPPRGSRFILKAQLLQFGKGHPNFPAINTRRAAPNLGGAPPHRRCKGNLRPARAARRVTLT